MDAQPSTLRDARPPGRTDAGPPAPPRPHPDGERYARYWEPVLAGPGRRLLDRVGEPPRVFLDIGAGTGALALHAAVRWPAARVVAMDASAAMLSVARWAAHDQSSDVADRITWLVGDARAIPLEDASVDVVTAAFVLGLVEDRAAVLAEVGRVLRPRGALHVVGWIDVDVPLPADDVFEDVLDELAPTPATADVEPRDAAHPADAGELREELEAAGFAHVDARADELRHAWTPEAYLDFKQHFDEHELFDSLDGPQRGALVDAVADRWRRLPASAFELRAPLVVAAARRAA
jgi:ubiquinone/menaquinone biosynthesis C-methylase UbiE